VKQGKIMEVVDDRLTKCGGVDDREVIKLVYVA
jgi:hypothetical protein